MTPEEIERTINFILNQQAQFWAGIQELKERQHALTDLVGRLAQAEIELTNRFQVFMDKTDKHLEAHNRQLGVHEERMRANEDRFNAFMAVVERYMASRNGGRTSPEE